VNRESNLQIAANENSPMYGISHITSIPHACQLFSDYFIGFSGVTDIQNQDDFIMRKESVVQWDLAAGKDIGYCREDGICILHVCGDINSDFR